MSLDASSTVITVIYSNNEINYFFCRMSAATQEERDEWISRLQGSISHHPFYDMLANRKKKAQHAGAIAAAHNVQHWDQTS